MSLTLFPTPSAQGVAKLQDYYRSHCHMEVDEATAYQVLSGIMRFIYLTEIKPPRPIPPAPVPQAPPLPPPSNFQQESDSQL